MLAEMLRVLVKENGLREVLGKRAKQHMVTRHALGTVSKLYREALRQAAS